MSAANALLRAIHARLSGDAALLGLIGPDGIFDRRLARPKLPSIVIGELETRDFSTATEAGEEHVLDLEIWSRSEGRRQALEIATRVAALLHDAALVLEGAALVNLLHQRSLSRREPGSDHHVIRMRFRAVTE